MASADVATADGVERGVPDGLRFVDCDTHWTEPPDLWTSRVASKFKDHVPVLGRAADGRDSWMLNGELWASTGANAIGPGRQKVLGAHVAAHYDDIDPSAWSLPDRIALMDELGVHSSIVYPNGVGFASNHMFAIEDLEQRRNILTVYNDFLVDLQKESHDRLIPQALLPVWDMDFTVQEMTRLLNCGVRGFTLSDKPELIGLPELWQDYFDPMWDVFNQSGAVANFHIGSGSTKAQVDAARSSVRPSTEKPTGAPLPGYASVAPAWSEFGKQRTLAIAATQSVMSNIRIIVNLCFSNLFDRYPNLKVVSAESGIGWVPFVLEALEYQLDEMVTEADEVAHARRRPTEYFREHIYVMFWFEQSGPDKLISDVGVNNILVETDFPHSTCLYPGPMEHFKKVLAGIPTADVRRILQTNAAELYRLDI